jgi:hypothetical protein
MDPHPTTPAPIKKPAAKPTGKENGVIEGGAVKVKKSYKKRKLDASCCERLWLTRDK